MYDIPNCQFNGQQVEMKITSVLGHMMEYEFREPFKKWNSCKPEELFEAPMDKTVKKDMLNVERTLHDESRKCGILFLWLDCDLEGENIAFEVINICKSANPRLNVYRARFSALIPRDVFAAMSGPQRPNHNMSEAGNDDNSYIAVAPTILFSLCLWFLQSMLDKRSIFVSGPPLPDSRHKSCSLNSTSLRT